MIECRNSRPLFATTIASHSLGERAAERLWHLSGDDLLVTFRDLSRCVPAVSGMKIISRLKRVLLSLKLVNNIREML